jgi:hypothetical protein
LQLYKEKGETMTINEDKVDSLVKTMNEDETYEDKVDSLVSSFEKKIALMNKEVIRLKKSIKLRRDTKKWISKLKT